jgi:hypothetical protein
MNFSSEMPAGLLTKGGVVVNEMVRGFAAEKLTKYLKMKTGATSWRPFLSLQKRSSRQFDWRMRML